MAKSISRNEVKMKIHSSYFRNTAQREVVEKYLHFKNAKDLLLFSST